MNAQDLHKLMTEIAKRRLGVETLENSNSDSMDFHDVAIWQVEHALKDAYFAGRQAAIREMDQ